MRISLAFLLYLFPLLSAAAPAAPSPSSSTTDTPQLDTASNTPTSTDGSSSVSTRFASPSESTKTSTIIHKPTSESSPAHRVVGPSSHPPIASGDGQNTWRPNPTNHPAPIPSHHDDHRPHHSAATLVFEILGALAGVIFVLSVVRCIYSYKRTPTHDRITSVIHRHQLQREMEELERHPPRRDSLVEPAPPPYVPPPPSYIDENTPLSNRESASYGQDPFRPNG
ncbi:hypothetical protein C8R45DRAFT_1205807 [Mycena sanguinolenta]|nr:hypothetical protein C8R45DRAFT_1205807 [Mycena sanguinolenta]